MADDFLTRFEQRRQERLAADRSFPLAGETLIHKASVAPEVGQRLEEARDEMAAQLDQARAISLEIQKRIDSANGDGVDLSGIDTRAMRLTDDAVILAADETVLACLEPDSHEAWARLRDVKADYPLNVAEIMEITDYLLQRVTGVPTDAPADSSDGRTKTGKQSKAASSSTANASAH